MPTMTTVDWIPEPQLRALERLSAAIGSALAHRLVSVLLVGPGARPTARTPGEFEVLVVATAIELAQIRVLASVLKSHASVPVRVRTITRKELLRAGDVMALEIAEWGTHNVLLAGRDPFAELTLEPADLRAGIERELRLLAAELRNQVLWATARDDAREPARRAVVDGLERLTTVARHTLALVEDAGNDQAAVDDAAVLRRFCAWAGCEPGPLLALVAELAGAQLERPPVEGLAVLLPVIGSASVAVDRFGRAEDSADSFPSV